MAIINGRRVSIPDSGVFGEDLIREANPGPGRRAVLMQQGRFESIQPNRKYSKRDLISAKTGKEVKISHMPDRTKGSATPTFDGRRNALSKAIITEQVYDIAEHLFKQGVEFDEDDANWLVVPDYFLPIRWKGIARTSPLLISFPMEYPRLPPVGFYLRASLPVSPNGHFYDGAYHAANKAPLERNWKWYCVYIDSEHWKPARVKRAGDWKRGDNLWHYLTLVAESLQSAD